MIFRQITHDDATGAAIHIHRLAEPGYEHDAFDDSWELALGRVRVRALHTPRHRHAYHDIRNVPEGLDPARSIAGICGSGQRASAPEPAPTVA